MSDASQIGRVGHASWLSGVGVHVSREAHERITPETFASFARTRTDRIFVAEDYDTIFGFAATENADNYISDLWVCPSFEGYGIGTALLLTLETSIAKQGYDAAEIEVLTSNVRAMALYRHLGYRIVWQRTRQDNVLLIPLSKTLLRKKI